MIVDVVVVGGWCRIDCECGWQCFSTLPDLSITYIHTYIRITCALIHIHTYIHTYTSLTMVAGVEGGHIGEQSLGCADIGSGLISANMLLSRLHRLNTYIHFMHTYTSYIHTFHTYIHTYIYIQ